MKSPCEKCSRIRTAGEKYLAKLPCCNKNCLLKLLQGVLLFGAVLALFGGIFTFNGSIKTNEYAQLDRMKQKYQATQEEIQKYRDRKNPEEWVTQLIETFEKDAAAQKEAITELEKIASLARKRLTAEPAEYYLMLSALLLFGALVAKNYNKL